VRTFVQLLRIGFWMLPFQRGLTMLGGALACAGLMFSLPANMPGSTLPITFLGVALMLMVPLLAGGGFFRMLSARRTLMLLPHARGRLLAGMIGITLLATLVWIVAYYLTFLQMPARFRPDLEGYALMYVLTLSFATQCAIGVFIVTRAPVWALVVIIAWQLPSFVLRLLQVDDIPRLVTGPIGLIMVPLAWLAFGIWYMRTPQVSRSGWAGIGRQASAQASSLAAPVSREQAMTRWLLGTSTPARIGMQWGLAAAGLVALQWLLHWLFDPDGNPRAVNAMMFGTLSLCAIAVGAISHSIAARSRGLWLVGGRRRLELHGWCERQMLRVVLAIALPFLLVGGVLWLVAASRPAMPGMYLLVAMLAPGLAAAWFGLMQHHQRSAFDPLAALAIAAGWYYGLALPLFAGSAHPPWQLPAAQLALVVVLREVALVRWRGADWRRTQS
jgi:hypothetical protein